MEKLTPLGVTELPKGHAEPIFIFPNCFGPSNQYSANFVSNLVV